nr:TetR family transcriptional regulator [Streptacidiphilus fuscans]
MTSAPPPPPLPRSPQLSLTERRKAATQLDIARAAAELFAERGPDGTTAEEIAQRAGIALRTFYRYFRSKEDAVSPLLSAGGAQWRGLLAETVDRAPGHSGSDLRDALVTAAQASMTPVDAAGAEALEGTRGLLRAAAADPALRAVWYRVNQESEEQLVPVLAALPSLAERSALDLRMIAAGATDAIRLSLEAWAATDAAPDGPEGPVALVDRCMRTLLQWL